MTATATATGYYIPTITNPWCVDPDRQRAFQPCLHRYLSNVPERISPLEQARRAEHDLMTDWLDWLAPGDWCYAQLGDDAVQVKARLWYYSNYGRAMMLHKDGPRWSALMVDRDQLYTPGAGIPGPPELPGWATRKM